MNPYVCPVCGGNGLVNQGFYNQTSGQWGASTTLPETCRTCGGTGIVWGLSQLLPQTYAKLDKEDER